MERHRCPDKIRLSADRTQVSLIIHHTIIFDVEQMRRNHKDEVRCCEIFIKLPRGERPRVLFPVDLFWRTM